MLGRSCQGNSESEGRTGFHGSFHGNRSLKRQVRPAGLRREVPSGQGGTRAGGGDAAGRGWQAAGRSVWVRCTYI